VGSYDDERVLSAIAKFLDLFGKGERRSEMRGGIGKGRGCCGGVGN